MKLVPNDTAVLDYIHEFSPGPAVTRSSATMTRSDRGEPAASLDDSGLVRRSREGDSLAFDELVRRYREKVLRLVTSTLGPSADIEDIAQDIFVKVYLSIERFRGDASFSTYLYTVTVNRCRDELRRSKIRRFFSLDEWMGKGDGRHPAAENEQSLDDDERRAAVRRAMDRLPRHTQMLLRLREVEELSYKELAEIFDVEVGTIKSRLARGRDRLREQLMPYLCDGTMPE